MMTTDFSPIAFPDLYAALKKKAKTLILVHRNPDADALGSAIALSAYLSRFGSESIILSPTPIAKRLSFLSDGYESRIFSEVAPSGFSPDRILSVDVASPSQLGNLYPIYEGKIDLMIDHHGVGQPFADYYVDPRAAASGEILFDLFSEYEKESGRCPDKKLSGILYAAISSDTGGFRYSNVTPETHFRAAKLIASGIDSAEINHRLFESKSKEQLTAEAEGMSHLECFCAGKIAIIKFPYALKEELHLSDEHLETLVEIARSLEGVMVAFAIRQPDKNGVFRVSARSSCRFDVSALCRKFGGGGHIRASGCTIEAENIDKATEALLAEMDFSDLN